MQLIGFILLISQQKKISPKNIDNSKIKKNESEINLIKIGSVEISDHTFEMGAMLNRFSTDIAKGVSPVTVGRGDWRKLSKDNFRMRNACRKYSLNIFEVPQWRGLTRRFPDGNLLQFALRCGNGKHPRER